MSTFLGLYIYKKSKHPPNTHHLHISTSLQEKQDLQLIVLVRPCVLRHGLCLDRRRREAGNEDQVEEAGGCAAVSLLLMLRESNAAPPETKLDVWRQVSFQQAAQPPNPNTASSSPRRLHPAAGAATRGNFVPFGNLVCLAKWKPELVLPLQAARKR